MEHAHALIRLMADGEFHSGEALAARLGMTRSAVWKALRRACDDLGLGLESVRGRGYRLEAPLELLERERLLCELSPAGRAAIARLEIHQSIDSTNRHLMREASRGAPSATVCLAERQTAGRGRLGRAWVSPYGTNLYLSVLWRDLGPPAALGGLSLVAGAVTAEVLHAAGVEGIALKWPNDLLWSRRKLGGVLLEVSGEAQGPCALVIGIGINLRMTRDASADIDQPWVNLAEILGHHDLGRHRLAARIIDALLDALARFGRDGLEPFLPLWGRFDAFRGEPVRLRVGEREIRGRALGIAPDGALRLETADGEQCFHAGEVSLRSEERETS